MKRDLDIGPGGLPLLDPLPRVDGAFSYYKDPNVRAVAAYTQAEKGICAGHSTDDALMTAEITIAKDERGVNGARYNVSSQESFEALVGKLEAAGFHDNQG